MGLFNKSRSRGHMLSKPFRFVRYKPLGHKDKKYGINTEGIVETKNSRLVIKLKNIDSITLGKGSEVLKTHRRCMHRSHHHFMCIVDEKNDIEINLEFVSDDIHAERLDFMSVLLHSMKNHGRRAPESEDILHMMETLPDDQMLHIPVRILNPTEFTTDSEMPNTNSATDEQSRKSDSSSTKNSNFDSNEMKLEILEHKSDEDSDTDVQIDDVNSSEIIKTEEEEIKGDSESTNSVLDGANIVPPPPPSTPSKINDNVQEATDIRKSSSIERKSVENEAFTKLKSENIVYEIKLKALNDSAKELKDDLKKANNSLSMQTKENNAKDNEVKNLNSIISELKEEKNALKSKLDVNKTESEEDTKMKQELNEIEEKNVQLEKYNKKLLEKLEKERSKQKEIAYELKLLKREKRNSFSQKYIKNEVEKRVNEIARKSKAKLRASKRNSHSQNKNESKNDAKAVENNDVFAKEIKKLQTENKNHIIQHEKRNHELSESRTKIKKLMNNIQILQSKMLKLGNEKSMKQNTELRLQHERFSYTRNMKNLLSDKDWIQFRKCLVLHTKYIFLSLRKVCTRMKISVQTHKCFIEYMHVLLRFLCMIFLSIKSSSKSSKETF